MVNNGDSWETQKIPNAHTIGCNSVSWCPATEPVFDSFSQQRSHVKRLATAGCDNLVKIWKEEGDRWIEESKLEAHSDWVSFFYKVKTKLEDSRICYARFFYNIIDVNTRKKGIRKFHLISL